jgi:hypothetical protein
MLVHRIEGRLQCPLRIRLRDAAERKLLRFLGQTVPGREQDRDAAVLGCPRKVQACSLARQAIVAEDEIGRVVVEPLDRILEIVVATTS